MLIRVLDEGEVVCKNKSNELLVNVGAPLIQSDDVWNWGPMAIDSTKVLNNHPVFHPKFYGDFVLKNKIMERL